MMTEVTCAIIKHKGKVLVTQRSEKMDQSLLWEFPGGKIKEGEKAESSIVREIREELSIEVSPTYQLQPNQTEFTHNQITLIPFVCKWISGEIKLQEHKAYKWVNPEDLPFLEWCPADIPVVHAYLSRQHMSQTNKVLISSGSPWEDVVGYSRAVRVGNIVEVAGTTAVDENGIIVGKGDAYEQTKFVLLKIARALADAGAHLEDVVRTRMFVTDISQWEAIGKAHGEIFSRIKPAASMIEVKALIDPDLLIEIEVTAIIQD